MNHKKLVAISQVYIRRIVSLGLILFAVFSLFTYHNPWNTNQITNTYNIIEFGSNLIPTTSRKAAIAKSIEIITSRMSLIGESEPSIRAIVNPTPAIIIITNNDLEQSKLKLLSKEGKLTFQRIANKSTKNNNAKVSYLDYDRFSGYQDPNTEYNLVRNPLMQQQDISFASINKQHKCLELKFHNSGIMKLNASHLHSNIAAVVDKVVFGELVWSAQDTQGYLFNQSTSLDWAKELEILIKSGTLPYAMKQSNIHTLPKTVIHNMNNKSTKKTLMYVLMLMTALLTLLYISRVATVSIILLTIIHLLVITGAMSFVKTKINHYGMMAIASTLAILYAQYGRFLMKMVKEVDNNHKELIDSLKDEHNSIIRELVLMNLIVGLLSLLFYFRVCGAISCFCVVMVISSIASSLASWSINWSIIKRVFKLFSRKNHDTTIG